MHVKLAGGRAAAEWSRRESVRSSQEWWRKEGRGRSTEEEKEEEWHSCMGRKEKGFLSPFPMGGKCEQKKLLPLHKDEGKGIEPKVGKTKNDSWNVIHLLFECFGRIIQWKGKNTANLLYFSQVNSERFDSFLFVGKVLHYTSQLLEVAKGRKQSFFFTFSLFHQRILDMERARRGKERALFTAAWGSQSGRGTRKGWRKNNASLRQSENIAESIFE